MACHNKITQSIINTCNPVKGVEPIVFWDYRSNLAFTFVYNTITAITAAPLGRIEVKKFAINAGHEVVALENQANRFKHKLDAVINDVNQVVDEMDDVVFFVKENGSTTWKVYGAKFGCWKESQSAMINDNLNTIAVSFASREGMEEEYECYNTSIDIAALPNMESFDLIYGGTIATGGVVRLQIEGGLNGYVKLPNGTVQQTNGSGVVLLDPYTGVGGAITYYVPKVTALLEAQLSDIAGYIVYDGSNSIFQMGGNAHLLGITAKNVSNTITCSGSVALTNLIAPKATTIDASNCALTAKSIGDILYAAYIDNRENVDFNFSVGANAGWDDVKTYIFNTYGITGQTVVDSLDVTGEIFFND